MNQPGRPARPGRRHDDVLERRGRGPTGRSAAVADAGSRRDAGRRPRSGRRARTGSRRSLRRSRPGEVGTRQGDGTRGRAVKRGRARRERIRPIGVAPSRRYTPIVAKRDPHDVLGVEPTATPTQIKAAWRQLARQHHPDLIGDDPEASRVATRQMAEINEAYAAMTRGDYRGGPIAGGRATARPGRRPTRAPRPAAAARPPRPTRPVTGRVDLSGTVPAAQRADPPAADERLRLQRQGPASSAASRRSAGRPSEREPPRASHPTGPLERDRVRNFRPPPLPPARRGPSTTSSSSASSAATRSARSRRSSRPTSTGWPGRSPATRSSSRPPGSCRPISTAAASSGGRTRSARTSAGRRPATWARRRAKRRRET